MAEKENGCGYGEVTRTMLMALGDKFDTFYNNDFLEVKKCVKDIKNGLTSRPSWAVSIIITLLSSVTVGSIAFLIGSLVGK